MDMPTMFARSTWTTAGLKPNLAWVELILEESTKPSDVWDSLLGRMSVSPWAGVSVARPLYQPESQVNTYRHEVAASKVEHEGVFT